MLKLSVVFAAVAFATVSGAQDALPLVSRSAAPPATAPAGCDEPTLVTAVSNDPPAIVKSGPAVRVPPPAPVATPVADSPSPTGGSAVALLTAAHEAAGRGDFPAFSDRVALAARKVSAGGSEVDRRLVATVQTFTDLDRVWRYSRESSAGAFFDDETLDGMSTTLRKRYPRFGGFIEPFTVRDERGKIFDASRETRAFLLEEAGKRLRDLGVRASSTSLPVARSTPSTERRQRSETPTRTPTRASLSTPSTRRSDTTTTSRGSSRKAETKTASSATSPSTTRAAVTSGRTTPAPAPVRPPVSTPPPAPESSPSAETPSPALHDEGVVDTATGTSVEPVDLSTASPAPTASSDTGAEPAGDADDKSSNKMILALLLGIIGIVSLVIIVRAMK